jgi:sugar phosphate isomerase/epimerase
MNPIGVNPWVWVSPPDATIADIAPREKAMGFELLELGVENPGDWDSTGYGGEGLGCGHSPRRREAQPFPRLRGCLGADHIPWQSITTTLHEIGYDGAVFIGSFTPDNQPIARAAIWRPLAESQVALAQDGLAFLHDAFA